jgi:ABC-type nitrate/sulfonate/bicarbonate transport system substrate-binding protein
MGAINAAQLYSSGVPMVVLRAVSPADIWAVVVKPDSTLKSPADFKGKKYGVVSLSGTNYGTTFLSFKADGVDLIRDVKVSTLPPANLVTALEKGEIDGGTIYEPYLTTALKANRVKILFRPGDLYQKRFGEPFLALVISARKEFVEKNRAAAGKFISVMEDTLVNLNSNLDAAAQAHSECIPETKLTAAETKEYLLPYAPNVIKTRNEPAMVKSAQNLYDRLLEAKQLQQPVKAADFWVKP